MTATIELAERPQASGPDGDPPDAAGRPADLRALSNQELVGLLRTGSDEGWRELVRRFTPLVRATACRMGLTETDAADAMQATWLQVLRGLRGLRRPECLPGWIAQTARREALRVSLSTARAIAVGDSTASIPPPRERGADAAIIDRQVDAPLASAIGSLPGPYQDLLSLLTSPADLSYADIASRLDIAVGSIGPMRQRALRLIRTRVADGATGGRLAGRA